MEERDGDEIDPRKECHDYDELVDRVMVDGHSNELHEPDRETREREEVVAPSMVIRHDERAQAEKHHGERINWEIFDDRADLGTPQKWCGHEAEDTKNEETPQIRGEDEQDESFECAESRFPGAGVA